MLTDKRVVNLQNFIAGWKFPFCSKGYDIANNSKIFFLKLPGLNVENMTFGIQMTENDSSNRNVVAHTWVAGK